MSTNRKTISPENVLEALADLELEAFIPRVEAELRKFNEIQTGKRNEYRRKLKEGKDTSDGRTGRGRKSAGGAERTNGLEDDENHVREGGQGDEGEERAAKRVKRGSRDGEGPEGQLVDRKRGGGEGETGLEEGDTAVDAAIEAVDAAIRAEEEGEEDAQEEDEEGEGEDEDDDESDSEIYGPTSLDEKMEMTDVRIMAMEAGLSSGSDVHTSDLGSDPRLGSDGDGDDSD